MPRLNVSHSEAVTAILSRHPHWLLRSGTAMLALGMALLVGFAALIRYPDVVRGEARITTPVPPVPIQGASGQIQVLNVAEGDTVAAQQVLAVLSQDLPFAEVSRLRQWTDSAVIALASGLEPLAPPRPTQSLGGLQAPHAALLTAYDARRIQIAHNLPAQGRAAAQERLKLLEQRAQRLTGQEALLREKLRIATDRFRADSALWKIGSASLQEVEASREAMISAQEAFAQAQAEVLDRDLLAANAQQDMQRFALEQARSGSDTEAQLWRALEGMRAAIAIWEEQHLLRAPFAGVLSFDQPAAVGQQLLPGQTFAWLIPVQAGPRIARVRIPAHGAGKVERGQQVILSLADYPRAEFGTLKGEVTHLSPLPIDGQYHVDVALPADLRSSLGQPLGIRGEAIGQAEIVTRDRSLLARLFSAVTDALGD